MRHRQLPLLLAALCLLPFVSSIRIRRAASIRRNFFFPRGGSSLTGFNPSNQNDNSNSSPDNSNNSDPKERIIYNLCIPTPLARFLYTVSALNPLIAVLFNDYSRMKTMRMQPRQTHYLARTYETLFYFARLKPRVSFSIGAMLRGLQLTTAFQYVFDPTAGCGLGLNLICLFARSRWPATVVLGWALTKPMWKILGACPPSGLPVPITISLKAPKDAPVVTKGYRIGL